ncbi:MAG: ABC transporter permease [Deltaproteobacteria bacterium]|nr:ABC transporter permease [Deltaproteobacteria bacterium]
MTSPNPRPKTMTLSPVWLIARRELAGLFASRAAWWTGAAYLFLTGLLFNAMALGPGARPSSVVLESFFTLASGLTLLAVPLLSFRLIAEERQTGSWVLLETAPVTPRQILWGKFLSVQGFHGLLLGLTAYLPALVFLHGRVAPGHLLAGYLGLGLLAAALTGVSLAASALGRGLLTAGVFAALGAGGWLVLWLAAPVSAPPLNTALAHLALYQQHFPPFARGQVWLKDLWFYGAGAVLGVEWAAVVLRQQREKR